jgi:HAD superfamily hydrolase (TIGR01549 family)
VAPLALFDLDNTLLDRDRAFAIWAQRFIENYGLPSGALDVMIVADNDGFRERSTFFAEVQKELGVTATIESLVADYRDDYPSCFTVDEGTIEAIRQLRSSGWRLGIVTNGASFQMDKLRATKLVDEFDAVCISAVVGVSKPELAIFESAARLCGAPLEGWTVGDSASADVEGGRRAGLKTIWMARGRVWGPVEPGPDAIVATVPQAVAIILSDQTAH